MKKKTLTDAKKRADEIAALEREIEAAKKFRESPGWKPICEVVGSSPSHEYEK